MQWELPAESLYISDDSDWFCWLAARFQKGKVVGLKPRMRRCCQTSYGFRRKYLQLKGVLGPYLIWHWSAEVTLIPQGRRADDRESTLHG